MPEFEVFVERHRAPPGRPEVGIQTRGVFALNLAAYRALGEPASVELLWAAENHLLGIGAASPEQPHTYPVRLHGKATYLVSGRAFMDHHQIDYSIAHRLPAHREGTILVVDLTELTARDSSPGTEGME